MTEAERATAGLRSRSLAFVLDYIWIGSYLALLVAVGVLADKASPRVVQVLFGGPLIGEATGFLLITLPVGLYFALQEGSTRQATWGKRRSGLRVVDTDGQRLSPGRSAGRTALKLVPWELAHFVVWQISFAANQSSPVYAFGFLLVWLLVAANLVSLLVSPRDQTLYDLVTRTQVLHCRSPLT